MSHDQQSSTATHEPYCPGGHPEMQSKSLPKLYIKLVTFGSLMFDSMKRIWLTEVRATVPKISAAVSLKLHWVNSAVVWVASFENSEVSMMAPPLLFLAVVLTKAVLWIVACTPFSR